MTNVTAIDFQKETDLVGITTLTITAQRAYEIADSFRARGVKVILGGSHPSALPEEASQHADAVVIGEAEGIWPNVIDDFKASKLQRIYSQRERPSLLSLPIPRRDLFTKRAYYCTNTISTTRGCPYACSFCSVTSFFGHTYRCRPVEEILKEIETLSHRKLIGFVDDCLVVDNPVTEAREFFFSSVARPTRDIDNYLANWGNVVAEIECKANLQPFYYFCGLGFPQLKYRGQFGCHITTKDDFIITKDGRLDPQYKSLIISNFRGDYSLKLQDGKTILDK